MLFLFVGVVMLALKLLEVTFVAQLSWWYVLAPFPLAMAWWAWSDWSGRTKRKAVEKMEKKRVERVQKHKDHLTSAYNKSRH